MKFQRRDKLIAFRVKPEEQKLLEEKAKEEGRSVSNMIRYALKKVFGINL